MADTPDKTPSIAESANTPVRRGRPPKGVTSKIAAPKKPASPVKAATQTVPKPEAKTAEAPVAVKPAPVEAKAPPVAAKVDLKPTPTVTQAETKPVPVAPKIEPASSSPKPTAVATAAKTVEAPAAKTVEAPAAKTAPIAKAAPAAKAKPAVPTPSIAMKSVAAKAPIATKPKIAPTPAHTILEGSKIMNDTVKKVEETAKKFTAEAGAKMQSMLTEATEKAKGAYEKSVKLAEEMTEFSKGNVEAMVESSKLAAKGAESLGQEAADYARKSFESSTAAFKTFASAKSPTELFKLQSDYMKSSFDAAVAESSKVTEAWLKLAGEIVQPVSNRVAMAMEKARAVAL